MPGDDRQPYVGPRPFTAAEQDRFFGRERDLDELTALFAAHPAVLLYGPAGTGKTSLLFAGLIPRLRQLGYDILPVVRFRGVMPPAPDARAVANPYVFETVATWVEAVDDQARLPSLSLVEGLRHRLATEDSSREGGPRLLVFDEFDAFFGVYPEHWPQRAGFFKEVADLLRADPLARILFVLREESVGKIERYAHLLAGRLQARYYLAGLTRDAALRAVTGALAGTGSAFVSGAAERIVDDLLMERIETGDGRVIEVVGEFVNPTYLQVVCDLLWQSLPPGTSTITPSDVELVDADRALASYYDDVARGAASATGVDEAQIRRWCEDALITSSGQRAVTGEGSGQLEELPRATLDSLVDQHLIRREVRSGTDWYELAHPRLVEAVLTSNAAWFAAHPSALQLQARLWDRQGRPDELLLRGEAVAEAERRTAGYGDRLTSVEQVFLRASREHEINEEVAVGTRMTVDPIWRERRVPIDDQLCFMLMPFREPFNEIYQDHIKPAVEGFEESKLRCVRADDLYGVDQIMEDIWEQICRARVLVAELTGRNPNVFYELGIAHTVGKPVVLITQTMDDVPFDLRQHRCIVYEFTPRGVQQLKDRLAKTLRSVLSRAV